MSSNKSERALIWSSSAYSHIGHQRNENQDAVYSDCRGGLWCVADGMGGHYHGRMASRLLASTLEEVSSSGSLDARVGQVESRVRALNQFLYQQGLSINAVIGCTFVTLISDGVHCCCLWAGDSRLYLQRNGQLFRVTDDHTVVRELIVRGVITSEQSATHPQKHAVTRALGAKPELAIDKKTFAAADGDRFLLCSDGLHNEIKNGDILSALSGVENRQSCRVLLDKVLSGDAPDNLSMCVISAQTDRYCETKQYDEAYAHADTQAYREAKGHDEAKGYDEAKRCLDD